LRTWCESSATAKDILTVLVESVSIVKHVIHEKCVASVPLVERLVECACTVEEIGEIRGRPNIPAVQLGTEEPRPFGKETEISHPSHGPSPNVINHIVGAGEHGVHIAHVPHVPRILILSPKLCSSTEHALHRKDIPNVPASYTEAGKLSSLYESRKQKIFD